MGKSDFLAAELEALREAGNFNRIRTLGSPQGGWIEADGKRVLNFCSNNYLGLANDPRLIEAAKAALRKAVEVEPRNVTAQLALADLAMFGFPRLDAIGGQQEILVLRGFARTVDHVDRRHHALQVQRIGIAVLVILAGDPVVRRIDSAPSGRSAVSLTGLPPSRRIGHPGR